MVGLTDQNLKVNARIRVGQDFGVIKYIGQVKAKVDDSNFLFLEQEVNIDYLWLFN